MQLFVPARSNFALVVGGGRGIGLGFVNYLLETAAVTRVFATHRRASAALAQLQTRYPNRLTCILADVTDEAQVAAIAAHITPHTDRLHFVINCVGFLHSDAISPEKSLRQIEPAALLRYFEVNSISAVLLAKHLLPLLAHSDPNLFATLSAKIGSIEDNRLGGWYGYRASKAALNMLMKTAAIEYSRRSQQTTIVLLHPGTTDTALSQPFQRGIPPEQLFSVDRTVSQLMAVIDHLPASQTGAFYAWDGSPLPW